MERHRDNQTDSAFAEKFLTAVGHELSQRFTERHFPAVFEFLHHLTQWLLFELLSGIAGPSSGGGEVGRARKADAADMIFPAGVWKWSPAHFA